MSQVPAPYPDPAHDACNEAEDAIRQLQSFADAVAHDLRAPLRSIQGFSRLLEDRVADQLDDTARDHLQRIRRAADRMDGLLVGLGELSRATGHPLRREPVDLGLLCDWVLAELADAHPGRSTEVAVEGLEGLQAEGDEHLLKLALTRLMENSWSFARQGEPVRIRVDGSVADGQVHLRLADRGIGFDRRYAHKMFQPFQRLHGPEQGAGHGLGLAVAHRVVVRHGGTLEAESSDNGAVFHLRLPAAARRTEVS